MTDTPPPADDLVERLTEAARNPAPDYDNTGWTARTVALVNEAAASHARLRQKLEDAEAVSADLERVQTELDEEHAALTLAQSQRDALAKAAEPFARMFAEKREAYAARYKDSPELGRSNFDNMPNDWPISVKWLNMGDLRALASARAQAMGE